MSQPERPDEPIEGVIVETITDLAPFADAAEAQTLVNRATDLMTSGALDLVESQRLFEQARQREAWRVLGFENWDQLVATLTPPAMRQIYEIEDRRSVVATIVRATGASQRAISKIVGVSRPTITRDVQVLEERGELGPRDEPQAIPGLEVAPQNPKPRRSDLVKTMRRHTQDVARLARLLEQYREDDRYVTRLEDMWALRGDLEAAHAILGLLLEDLQAVAPERGGSS